MVLRHTVLALVRFCRGVAATALALLLTALLIPLGALFAAFGKIQPFEWSCRTLARATFRAAGTKPDLRGLENIENVPSFVLVVNHQSVIDILAILAWFPRRVRFVAKKELSKIPIFGPALKNGGHIVVDRKHGGQALRKAVEIAQKGYCIVIFAEGHRFIDGRVHHFNQGAAWLALLTKMPCVPMAIHGSAALMRHKLLVPGRTIHLTVGTPVPVGDMSEIDRDKLTRELEKAVRDLFAGQCVHPRPAMPG